MMVKRVARPGARGETCNSEIVARPTPFGPRGSMVPGTQSARFTITRPVRNRCMTLSSLSCSYPPCHAEFGVISLA